MSCCFVVLSNHTSGPRNHISSNRDLIFGESRIVNQLRLSLGVLDMLKKLYLTKIRNLILNAMFGIIQMLLAVDVIGAIRRSLLYQLLTLYIDSYRKLEIMDFRSPSVAQP